MLNREKVILMTRLAEYEQKEGRKEIPLSKYFRSDYIGLHLIGSFFAITICYVLVAALYFAYKSEEYLANIVKLDLFKIGRNVLIGYVIFLVINMLIAYVVYWIKFVKIRKHLKEYNRNLKKLRKIYDKEQFGEDGGEANDDVDTSAKRKM